MFIAKTALLPSLISANLLALQKEIDLIDSFVDGYHLDVMDFHFVPNLTWGPEFVNKIRSATQKTLFIHLMVEYPEKYFERFELFDKDIIAIHYESPSEYSIEELLRQINSYGWTASLALNLATNLDPIYSLKHTIENVLLMSVNPGFSGQTLMPNIYGKLKTLSSWRREYNLNFNIGVDGGINASNCSQLAELGADQLAIASAIFNSPNRVAAIREIKDILENS